MHVTFSSNQYIIKLFKKHMICIHVANKSSCGFMKPVTKTLCISHLMSEKCFTKANCRYLSGLHSPVCGQKCHLCTDNNINCVRRIISTVYGQKCHLCTDKNVTCVRTTAFLKNCSLSFTSIRYKNASNCKVWFCTYTVVENV